MITKPPSKNSKLFYLYLVPVMLIFSSIFNHHITLKMVPVSLLLAIVIYMAFSSLGKHYNLAYSLYHEINFPNFPKAFSRQPLQKRLIVVLKRFSLLYIFYVFVAALEQVSGSVQYPIMGEASVVFGFVILFYIVIDLILAKSKTTPKIQ